MKEDASEAARLEVLKPWVAKATKKIKSKVESAAAHAEKALTRAAIESPDGRMTWRTLNGQKSHNAAQERLDELCEWLVGKTALSLAGLVQDARADFYRRAFKHWTGMISGEYSWILDPEAKPTTTGERNARGLMLFGLPLYQEVQPIFSTAKRNLMTTLNAAASANQTQRQRATAIDLWERQTADSIYKKIAICLSDSEVAIATLVGQQMIKPSLRANGSDAA